MAHLSRLSGKADDSLVPVSGTYKMITISPYQFGGRLWEDIDDPLARDILLTIARKVYKYGGFAPLTLGIESASRLHIHLVVKDELLRRSNYQLARYVHKICGKPKTNSFVCCNVRSDTAPEGFMAYAQKEAHKCPRTFFFE